MKILKGIYTALLTPFTKDGKINEKEVINQLGFDFGDCLPPFSKVSEEQKVLIAEEIMPFIKNGI